MRFFFGIFFVLHCLVHLLYFGQSARCFELKPGMVWPDGSWAFSRLLGNEATRNLTSISLMLVAIGLIIGGAGILIGQAWWRPVIIAATTFSTVLYIFLWNGRMQDLDSQGLIGLLINMAILFTVYILRLPTGE